jgi:hypothetical protein
MRIASRTATRTATTPTMTHIHGKLADAADVVTVNVVDEA